MKKLLLLTTLLLASQASQLSANDRNALSIDRAISSDIEFNFPNDDNIYPDKSDFKVVNYVTMSNEYGQRKVTVTLQNTSSGDRIFVSEQIMALYANGHRSSPLEKKIRFKGREVQTLTLSFSTSEFPILQVYTRQ
ncbi:hypothetical protein GCM10009123_01310 [Kangiella japonica]|uniref:Uncharacterized protein n=1 Tax=Kangiella japonica TaxID=647384 RepID=A0ABP3CCS7_9GAMM